MVHLVQIANGSQRRVALVAEPHLACLAGVESVYELASACMRENASLSTRAQDLATGEQISYDDVYSGKSAWRLLPPIDVPGFPERVLVSGTGLTHLGSAKDRQAMHTQTATAEAKPMTDSMRMFEWGIAGGRPKEGEIGVAPEWFYKGHGDMLQAPFAPLTVTAYAEDGGEEAEIAGVYLIAGDGTPHRIGMCAGNEFSDHRFERRNYLNLAGSKLRPCSIGPELVVGAEFRSAIGEVSIERGGVPLWQKAIETGEENMSHSLANLEHHHFKFEGHRVPGSVHVHFFGAHSLSFGEGIELRDGDWMQVRFEGYGRPLRNPLRMEDKQLNRLVRVQPFA
ncbi:MAG: GguC protein [Acidobacteriota bacterium]|nr:GguC protein [Acidobacteriota bacterium]